MKLEEDRIMRQTCDCDIYISVLCRALDPIQPCDK